MPISRQIVRKGRVVIGDGAETSERGRNAKTDWRGDQSHEGRRKKRHERSPSSPDQRPRSRRRSAQHQRVRERVQQVDSSSSVEEVEKRSERRTEQIRQGWKDFQSSADSSPLGGIASLVRMFGTGWFNIKLFNTIYNAVSKETVRGDADCPTVVSLTNFKRSFTMIHGRKENDWNEHLSDNLAQIQQVRRDYADEYTRLSEDATTKCLWQWATTFVFASEQAALPKRKQRSIFWSVLAREVGCIHRLRAVVRRGLKDLKHLDGYHDDFIVCRFIDYIKKIEEEADDIKRQGEKTQLAQRYGSNARPGDASQRATITSLQRMWVPANTFSRGSPRPRLLGEQPNSGVGHSRGKIRQSHTHYPEPGQRRSSSNGTSQSPSISSSSEQLDDQTSDDSEDDEARQRRGVERSSKNSGIEPLRGDGHAAE